MHLLVVEDDTTISSHIKRSLEEAKYTVTCVFTGADALHKITTFHYDAIFLDLLLPDMDGIEVCRQIRKNDPTTPILMLTSQSDIDSRVQGLDAGADDYLCKPFSFDELIARVRALLRRGTNERRDTIEIGPVSLDPAKFQVLVHNTLVPLTNKEYEMLEYLMRHHDQVCTKLMLEEHVWGSRYEQESNIIEVTVSRLRRKIEEAGAVGFIQTKHGLGYSIEQTSWQK